MSITDKVKKALRDNKIEIEDIDARYKLINDLVTIVYDTKIDTIKECFDSITRGRK